MIITWAAGPRTAYPTRPPRLPSLYDGARTTAMHMHGGAHFLQRRVHRGRPHLWGRGADAGTGEGRNSRCSSVPRSAEDLQVLSRRRSQDPQAALCLSQGDPRGSPRPAAGIKSTPSPLGVKCLTHLRQILPLYPACAEVYACGLEDHSHPQCVDTEFAVL